MKHTRLPALALAGLLLLSTAGCGKAETTQAAAPKGTAVEVQPVASGDMSAQNALAGTVTAVKEVQVFPMLAGRVTALNVAEGDTVQAGQLLFEVDTSTVTSTYASLQQSYNATKQATDQSIANAQLGVQRAQIALEQAQTALDNTKAMLEVGAASEQQLTTAQQAVTNAQVGVQQAQAGVQQAQAQQQASLAQVSASMAQIQAQAKLGTVTAPVSGLVTTVNLQRGGMAAQSAPAVIIAEGGNVQLTVAVSETVLAGLKIGDSASCTLESVSKEPMNATITTIANASNAQTKLYDVTLSLPNGVKPPIGAFANVTLYTDKRDNAIRIPTEAILTDGETQYVFIVTDQQPAQTSDATQTATDDSKAKDDKTANKEAADTQEQPITHWAKQVTVTTGLVGDGVTEITSGLTRGQSLVVKGQSYLSDGAGVRIVTGKDA